MLAFFFFFLVCITACVRISSGKTDLPRPGSTAEAFAVMCCNGLALVVLWCWCFVCWSSRHPARRPLCGRASKLAPSHLIHAAAGALKLNPATLEVKKKVGCGLFLEKTSRTKNFLKEPWMGFGTSVHLWGREQGGGSTGCARASMYFRDRLYFHWS